MQNMACVAALFPILWLATFTVAEETVLLPKQSIKKHPDTVLVLYGMRHGNRNPENFVNPVEKSWGLEGPMELTRFGKLQALGLGTALRQFVGKGFLDDNYLPKEASFFSSSAARCQMTLQASTAGLYTPVGWGDWSKKFDNWSPVPYSIDDPMLRMYAVSDCPNSDKAWAPISDDTWGPLAEKKQKGKVLLDYMAKNTGWDAAVSKAADLADNIIEIKLYNATLPDWLEHPTLPGYDKDSLVKAYMEFAEAHQNACAENEDCRRMMGGYWLKNVLDAMKKAKDGKGPKIIGYASHTEVTLALMKLMGYKRNEITTTAGFAIEFRNKPNPGVRLLDHDPNPVETHVIYKAALIPELEKLMDNEAFIDLDKFEAAIQSGVISKWEEACGRHSCAKP
ncbi:unnamed protein product, partial [Mesorhabditis spiculigera]